MRFRVRRWEVPVGESLSAPTERTPSLWAVDEGAVMAMPEAAAAAGEEWSGLPVRANTALWAMSLNPADTPMLIENAGEGPAVLYELIVEPAPAA